MTERDDRTDDAYEASESTNGGPDDGTPRDQPGDGGAVDFSGSDRNWLWFLVIAVFPATFIVSYALLARHRLETAANPPGVRMGIVSRLFGTDAVIALVFGGLTFLVVLYFSYRYAAGRVSRPVSLQPRWGANTFRLLVIGVAVIMIVTFMFAGTSLANTDQMSAQDAKQRYGAQDEINMTVVASQWVWRDNVQGVNYTQTDKVRVPANTLVHVKITSADVDHSWAVEQLAVKKDAIPGQITTTWLYVKKPGTYQVNCAELCGAGHSDMTQKLVVMPKDKYVQWAHSNGYSVPFANNSTNGNTTNGDLTHPTRGVAADV